MSRRYWISWETAWAAACVSSAHALNQLPPRYVVSHMGGAISKADTMRIQHLTDVRTAVLQAAQVVKEHPRH